jgi:hypothetical protein
MFTKKAMEKNFFFVSTRQEEEVIKRVSLASFDYEG